MNEVVVSAVPDIVAYGVPFVLGMIIGAVIQRHRAEWNRKRIALGVRNARMYLERHAPETLVPPPTPPSDIEPSVRIVPRTWGISA